MKETPHTIAFNEPLFFSDDAHFNGAVFTTPRGDDIAITRKSSVEDILNWAFIVAHSKAHSAVEHLDAIVRVIYKLSAHHAKVAGVWKELLKRINGKIEDSVEKRRTIERGSVHDEFLIASIDEHVRIKKKIQMALQKRDTSQAITESDIIRAKEYPMESLIEFNSAGKAHCIFPDHTDDHTPSLTLYRKTNTVYCFGCHKSADTIAIHQALHGSDFINAVRALI